MEFKAKLRSCAHSKFIQLSRTCGNFNVLINYDLMGDTESCITFKKRLNLILGQIGFQVNELVDKLK